MIVNVDSRFPSRNRIVNDHARRPEEKSTTYTLLVDDEVRRDQSVPNDQPTATEAVSAETSGARTTYDGDNKQLRTAGQPTRRNRVQPFLHSLLSLLSLLNASNGSAISDTKGRKGAGKRKQRDVAHSVGAVPFLDSSALVPWLSSILISEQRSLDDGIVIRKICRSVALREPVRPRLTLLPNWATFA
ncbi:uncharacterized protein SPSK_01958 [Sporothrix schenckii 1099-18]|uniref:Uncharacterized protein n=1 Tax=Sporothrix schenckii 1099-18 TaxID=1397361 RepID=A0A0F2MFS5_SPOSC|nr:uncharacterized protein SPSK_01958 [Sporothrix schenckii 1099-18]KJR87006.1 hypothetical protein SPSK_01958 [Sporothrix schenckii 1099-18]